MPCRIGMTKRDVDARLKELQKEKKVGAKAKGKLLHKGLTYKKAQEKVSEEIKKCRGPNRRRCDGGPGGVRDGSRAWKVYKIEW